MNEPILTEPRKRRTFRPELPNTKEAEAAATAAATVAQPQEQAFELPAPPPPPPTQPAFKPPPEAALTIRDIGPILPSQGAIVEPGMIIEKVTGKNSGALAVVEDVRGDIIMCFQKDCQQGRGHFFRLFPGEYKVHCHAQGRFNHPASLIENMWNAAEREDEAIKAVAKRAQGGD